ncbi:hypothetical protein CSW64_13835 [Caulobacter mirabilis]|uniref:Transglutaminase-like domain-containing protein n=2 Tax=Caulobacter mirabilis TaxID=69666 RepID=A0A2D2AZH6_9CAUL|nr:hypothetical protein CSW64_13835 [Caulobacter mirabilis]
MAQGLSAVPSVQVLKGELVSPAAASAYYGGGTTSTNGLCAQFPSNAQVCTTLRPPEVKELARALRGDPDLIYEYVRNGIDTEFQYGLQKGALGVIIDKSGTAFDQASLMVELLRESGITASYKVGTITLTGPQFQAWTGLDQAKAACQFLALGGIPAIINGSSPANCALSGSVSSVTLGHAWVEATIGGGTYQFDPAYKPYTHKAGIDVKAGMGFTAGEIASAAGGTTGSSGSASYVTAFNQTALNGKLQTWSSALLARLRLADLQGADLADVVGGREIQAATRPAGGWRQGALPYTASAYATWSGGVPDQYRTTLRVASAVEVNPGQTQTVIDKTLFVDEIYGRNLGVQPKRALNLPRPPGSVYDPYKWSAEVFLDNVVVATGPTFISPIGLDLPLTLTANHPYAAAGGTYADASVQKTINYNLPSLIAHGWGATSTALAARWDREEGVEGLTLLPVRLGSRSKDSTPTTTTSGKLMRMRIQATWLAQFSASGALHAELAGGRFTHHHSLGVITPNLRVVSAIPIVQSGEPPQPLNSQFFDEVTVVDLETAFGVVSKTDDAAARRAAVHAIAATGAMLEGSVAEQLSDSPDSVSTARRFSWGNEPEASETPNASSRLSYGFTAANASSARSLMVTENLASGAHGKFAGQEAWVNVDGGKIGGAATIVNYTGAGFDVTASSETSLGPGFRHGSVFVSGYVGTSGGTHPVYMRNPSSQVGGALIANRYDGAGDPVDIAHVVLTAGAAYKGGGANIIKEGVTYDPNKAAQTLKDRFVDRSSALGVNLQTGSAGYESPVLASVGAGEMPFRLDHRIAVRGGGLRQPSPLGYDELGYQLSPTGDVDGVVSNWESAAVIGGSGAEALGESLPAAGVQAIVAFTAMQDSWRQAASPTREVRGVLIADWLGREIAGNTVTINQGGATEQYVRLADGTYAPTAGGAARVSVTGTRQALRKVQAGICNRPGCDYVLSTSRYWAQDDLAVTAIGAHGDQRSYEFWKIGSATDSRQGHRLKTWTFPQGVVLTLSYPATVGVPAPVYEIPNAVSSNLGPVLNLPTVAETPYCTAVLSALQAGGGENKVTFNAIMARSVSQRPYRFCTLAEVYTPADTATPSLSYAYDSVGRVKEARDGVSIRQPGVRGAHQFFIAEGYRGERQDPEGGRYAVETLEGGRLTRTIDELGRVTTSGLDGRKRVVSRTYPEGDQDLFGYDVRDNMVSLVKKAKPGSGLADLTSTVSYGEGPLIWTCVNPKICNRPTASDGPRTDVVDVTSYSWNGSNGNLTQILKPADSGGTRPQTDYGYTVLGGVSLMTSMTEKIDSSSSTTTTYEYDAGAQYRLKASTVDSGGLNLRACYQYDAVGNITGVSDPRTATCPATIQ